jgi:hypothetical protein
LCDGRWHFAAKTRFEMRWAWAVTRFLTIFILKFCLFWFWTWLNFSSWWPCIVGNPGSLRSWSWPEFWDSTYWGFAGTSRSGFWYEKPNRRILSMWSLRSHANSMIGVRRTPSWPIRSQKMSQLCSSRFEVKRYGQSIRRTKNELAGRFWKENHPEIINGSLTGSCLWRTWGSRNLICPELRWLHRSQNWIPFGKVKCRRVKSRKCRSIVETEREFPHYLFIPTCDGF